VGFAPRPPPTTSLKRSHSFMHKAKRTAKKISKAASELGECWDEQMGFAPLPPVR
jgi:hypothetical protein